MTSKSLKVSIIIPMYNEESFIGQCLDGFSNQTYPKENFEIIVVDGMSSDDSKNIVKEYQKQYSNIILLNNEKRKTPISFNIGIKFSKSDVVSIFSAHSKPSKEYIETAIETLVKTKADCVGGPMNAISSTILGNAIAKSTSTPFGVGHSLFHYSKKPGYVNTVYQGFFYRELFYKIGFFDEDLIRNQDDEMSYRIQKYGGKIYYNPNIKSDYYSRTNMKKLFLQYFQYGLFKPLVFYKTKYGMQIHHFVPTIFSLYLISLFMFFDNLFYLTPLIMYIILNLYFSLISNCKMASKIVSIMIYPVLHISYGLGFIFGFFKLYKKKN